VTASLAGVTANTPIACGTTLTPGMGFFNRATLTNNQIVSDAEACQDITITPTPPPTTPPTTAPPAEVTPPPAEEAEHPEEIQTDLGRPAQPTGPGVLVLVLAGGALTLAGAGGLAVARRRLRGSR